MTPSASPSALIAQLPRYSKFDPGVAGEGSLDPLGLAAIGDRLAERIAPGIRARMSNPRFVTIATIGALACAPLEEVRADDGTTYDIAYEWLVVEALVRHRDRRELPGVPGVQKVRRAQAVNERVHKGNYLSGPRVFGFTGVYRPFARYADVIVGGVPGTEAERLVRAWEADRGITGFVAGGQTTPGGKLRSSICDAVRDSLKVAKSTAPVTGWLTRSIAECMGPSDAGAAERRMLRNLITDSPSDNRNELVHSLLQIEDRSPDRPESGLAAEVQNNVGPALRAELRAIVDYETVTTAIDDAFRRLLAFGAAQGGHFTERQAAQADVIVELAPLVRDLVSRAVDSVGQLPTIVPTGNLAPELLADETLFGLREFTAVSTPLDLVRALITTHQRVQGDKGKRMWIDPVSEKWVVRGAYGVQVNLRPEGAWVHQMRLRALVSFLTWTETA